MRLPSEKRGLGHLQLEKFYICDSLIHGPLPFGYDIKDIVFDRVVEQLPEDDYYQKNLF